MSDTFTQNDFDFLLNTRGENCLSLFMPTVKSGNLSALPAIFT